MVRAAWKSLAICALAQLGVSRAAAEALPLQKSLELGRPARAQQIALVDRAGLVAKIAGASVALPARGVKTASVESVAVAGDAAVAVVRASADNGEWVALLGGTSGRELLLAARTDLVGDPGERRAAVLEVAPDAQSGVSAVRAAVRYEGFNLCGTQQPWLAARRTLDPKTLKLVAQHAALDAPRGAPLVPALPAAAGGPAPLLRALSAVGSSQVDESTQTLHVPHSLVDGRDDTVWSAVSGDTALLRWTANGVPIERLEVRLAHRAAAQPPAQLTFFMDRTALRSELPNGAAPQDTWSISLPAKTVTTCLALAVAGMPGALEIAEVRAFSDLDKEHGGGMQKLISDLVQDGESAVRAADLLANLGEPAARLVASRFGELSTRGQRRALKVLATSLDLPEVRAKVVEAARNREDEHLSATALTTLSRGKAPGTLGLRELALLNEPAGDAAARILVLGTPSEAPALLAALATPQGADRALLRRSLVSVAQRDPAAFRAAVDGWLPGAPVAARVGLALVAVDAALPELATPMLPGLIEQVQAFADRYRLASLAGGLGPSEPLDAWLSQQSMSADEWMVRRAAFESLNKHNPEAALTLTLYVANDEYPRVRAAAAPGLAQTGNGERLALLASKDPWPLVRSTAAGALADVPGSRPVLEKLLDDTSRQVRTAAIDALTAQRSSESWALVEQRLSASAEWPEVQAAAVRFASTLCVEASRPQLVHLARRSLRADATDDERRLGLEALRALYALGGQAAQDAKQIVSREAAPPELVKAIGEPVPARCVEPHGPGRAETSNQAGPGAR